MIPDPPQEPDLSAVGGHLYSEGKSREDLVNLVEQLRLQAVAPAPTPTPQPTPTPAPVTPSVGINSEAIYSDTEGFVKSIQDFTQAQITEGIQSASTPLLQPLASMARSSAFADPENKDVVDAYGPEIDATMAALPLQNRTDRNTWVQAIEIVAGRHRKELARAEAEKLFASGDAGMLATGGTPGAPNTPSSNRSPISQLFFDNDPCIANFLEQGMNASAVIAHSDRMGYTETEYVDVLQSKKSRRHTTQGNK